TAPVIPRRAVRGATHQIAFSSSSTRGGPAAAWRRAGPGSAPSGGQVCNSAAPRPSSWRMTATSLGENVSWIFRMRRSMIEPRRSVPASSAPKLETHRATATARADGMGYRFRKEVSIVIRADLRSRLTWTDMQLVIMLLSGGSAPQRARLERRLEVEGPDALLDEPALPARLMAVRTLLVPSEILFLYVCLRHALLEAGVDDRDLADYMASLVHDFGRRDRAWRVDWNDDARHSYLVDI